MKIVKILSVLCLEKLIEFQKSVWKFQDIDCLPVHTLLSTNLIGGFVLGCYNNGQLVGFCQTLPAFDHEMHSYHYLHALGVSPDHRGKSVGFAIMFAHRLLSISQNIYCIRWTFDPLETANANLYLNKLGASVEAFKPNYYGNNMSGINKGVLTDRFLMNWNLTHDQTEDRISSKSKYIPQDEIDANFTIVSVLDSSDWKYKSHIKYAIKVPIDFSDIKREDIQRAHQIRSNSRKIFTAIYQSKKRIIDFVITGKETKIAYYLTN